MAGKFWQLIPENNLVKTQHQNKKWNYDYNALNAGQSTQSPQVPFIHSFIHRLIHSLIRFLANVFELLLYALLWKTLVFN